jgi:polysaccharide biosynthesis protein PslG
MQAIGTGGMWKQRLCGLAVLLVAAGGTALAADNGKTIEVRLGQTVQRTWDDVKKADYAYGPKQEYDAASRETHIWLPYGTKGVYFEAGGVTLSDPGPLPGTGCPLVTVANGDTSGRLVFKLHFDAPIGAMRCYAGWSEWGVGGDTVGGVEYSADGQKWTAIRQIDEAKAEARTIEPLADGKKTFGGLNTRDLYIRCYSRDRNNPDAGSGPGRWMKLRMGGDPAWGDVAKTFFSCQLQLWVTAAEGGGASAPAAPAAANSAGGELEAASKDARAAAREARAAAEEARKAAQEARAAIHQATGAAQPSLPAQHETPAVPKPVVPQAASRATSQAGPASSAQVDPRDDTSPWGIASGAEWSGDYPKFNPMLHTAGAGWLRLFPEWQNIQPRQGQWKWETADAMVADARANGIHLAGVWCYFAPWASADGGTRKGPIKDMEAWRDYVSATVNRYRKDIRCWEVWNEFNGSFYQGQDKVKEYAELVVAAYDAARKADPTVRIAMSVANFDVAFLDAAIKAGAADHFDFVCVHPYENLGAVAEGGEAGYLSLAGSLRDMLAANKQRKDIPLWITEIGYQAPIKPDAKGDARQADMLAKAYLLSIAQGFERVFWFEARGPAYGQGTDHGIIRSDWTVRPAYDALKTMASLLGPEPRCLGWLNLGEGGYGFVFRCRGGNVLAAWSPAAKQCKARFNAEVGVTDLVGKQSSLGAGQELVLTPTPVFISPLPDDLVMQAQANRGKQYPWGGNYAHARVVTCRLGATNVEDGLKQANLQTTVVVNGLTESCRRTDFANPALHNEGHYVYFRVDPLFVPFGTKELEITIVAKRVAPDKSAGMNLCYESAKGYRSAPGWWTIPAGDQWHENTWKVTDASFVGQWGWNLRFDAVSSPNEFLVKEVRVAKPGPPAK